MPRFSHSRGTTIITQKENKGEYGGVHCGSDSCLSSTKWRWNTSPDDWDIYAHVFDQNGPNSLNGGDGTPYKYSTNISDWTADGRSYKNRPDLIPRCTTASTKDTRKSLYSGTPIPYTDKACVANTHNAGNWYNFAAATAGSNNISTTTEKDMPNSICPKGWQLPSNSGTKSYRRLIRDAYQIANGSSGSMDSNFLTNSAMSFVRLGDYNYDYGSLNNRGNYGNYWSSTAYNSIYSHSLYFYSGLLNPQNGYGRASGYSIRCVSR